jgi:hemerythrin
MVAFHWNDNFLTGLTTVDKQHHHLVDLINQLEDRLACRGIVQQLVYRVGQLYKVSLW